MTEESRNDWRAFRVSMPCPSPRGFDCIPLQSVMHVTHVDLALDIVRAKGIAARRVSDDSILRDHDIPVVWLSPNDWSGSDGFRYGNIGFRVNWNSVLRGMDHYWVGIMRHGIDAVRIMLTDVNRPNLVIPYISTRGDGPWYDDAAGSHFWNGNICLEIMLERDVDLSEVTVIEFVAHNPRQCCISPSSCPDRGDSAGYGGARFIAGLVGRSIPAERRLFAEDATSLEPSLSFCSIWDWLKAYLAPNGTAFPGTLRSSDASAATVAAAILDAFFRKDTQAMAASRDLFSGEDALIDACAHLIESHIGFRSGSLRRTSSLLP